AGSGLIPQYQLDNDILRNNGSDSVPWHTAPDGLYKTLNCHRPGGFPSYFSDSASAEHEDTVARNIIWSIHKYATQKHRFAPVAWRGGGAQWVVVSGSPAPAAPTGPADGSYQIVDFDICDPAHPGPSPAYVLRNQPYNPDWQTMQMNAPVYGGR